MDDTPSIRGISLQKRLHAGGLADVYRAERAIDGSVLAVKRYRSADALAHARRELEGLRRCAHAGVPVVYELDASQPEPALFMELVPGVSLAGWVERECPDTGAFLRVARQLADVLVVLREQRILHCNLTPRNVLVAPDTLDVHLIGFGLARSLGAADRPEEARGPSSIERLAYIAPEQTSRTHRGLDHRCDLYMLGATLYFALTGRAPFVSDDPAELVHCHLAREPEPPCRVRREVPGVLSDLVCKLLAKEPADRYQTARALRADLADLASHFDRNGSLDGAVLGGADAPDRPQFSDRLVGREAELERLCAAYANVRSGEMRALMLAGRAGSGKSALVNELRASALGGDGVLASGKFDHYTERPYSGFIQAIDSVVQQQLLESDAWLARKGEELRAGLGAIARVVVDLVPDLGLVLGNVDDVPKLGPRETQVRLGVAVERLLRAWASADHPLVLFLDDLQWADAESRALLDLILASAPIPHLLLICSYRADDLAPTHSVRRLLAALARRGVAFEQIDVDALSPQGVAEMLAHALRRAPEETLPLAEEAIRHTGGSPLLVRQFIAHLHEQDLLWVEGARWAWDLERVRTARIPEGEVGLMTAEIERLPPEVRSVLQFASCIGDEVEAPLLARLGCGAEPQVAAALHALCDAGLLVPSPRGLRFAHDRIRESAQAQLSPETRGQLHYETGCWLLERSSLDDDTALFEVALHLNRGRDYLDESHRLRVVDIDVRAGKRALASGAAAHADSLLRTAIDLYREADWREHRSLGFELHLAAAESACQTGDLDRSLSLLAPAASHAESTLDSARLVARRIYARALRDRAQDVARDALAELRKLGIRWPYRPSAWRTRIALRRVRRMLREPSRDPLFGPLSSPSDRITAILLILKASGGARARGDYFLAALSTCFVLRESFRRGVIGAPAYFMAAYASQVRVLLDDAAESARFADLAREWIARAPDPVFGPRTEQQLFTQLDPWTMPRREAFAPVAALVERLRESGDLEFTFYSRCLQAFYLALAGDPLGETIPRLREVVLDVERAGYSYADPQSLLEPLRHLVREPGDGDLVAALDGHRAQLRELEMSSRSYAYTAWMMVLCFADLDARVLSLSRELGQSLWRGVPGAHIADHIFYCGLAAGRLATSARGLARSRHVRLLSHARARLHRFARSGPDFAHMETLLAAQHARVRGDLTAADPLFIAAATAADRQNFPHHAALAHECRADLLRTARAPTPAATDAVRQALDRYRTWGIPTKVTALERLLPTPDSD